MRWKACCSSRVNPDAADREQANLARQLSELQEKVATISGSDAKTWLLAQADFLVKMAGRKLWSDQDVTSAAALLKSADASLADMNDPSLLDVRRAITEDIGTLATLTQVDYDGIILKVNQLSNQVDNLRLADNDTDEAPMDQNSSELSGSLAEWRQNLAKSWRNFMADFITIRRRDASAEPLLAPNQTSTCAKTSVRACWWPHRPSRATRTRPTSNRWKPSPPGARLFRHHRSGDQGLPGRAGQPEPTVDLDGRAGSA